jgi:asparagine synthase (glutamine-hydrolysing)
VCGIVGFATTDGGTSRLPSRETLMLCVGALKHRGPDAEGIWLDEGVGFGHTRLAIRDLSTHGTQPMLSHSGRYVLAYNGEIYELDDLRRTLGRSGYSLRGHSDTEVLLGSIEVLGLEATLQLVNGMFAFAVFDRQERTVALARDCAGEKPLYWTIQDGVLYFGSELRPLKRMLPESPTIDRAAMAAFLRHNYVPGPYSIYEGIRKLKPAHYLLVRPSGDFRENSYWSYRDLVESNVGSNASLTDAEAVADTGTLLTKATIRRLESDAPLGVFLSGGIDSSLVTAIMQCNRPMPVKSYSAGFEDPRFDEQDYAKQIASHLGTDHHAFTFSERDALDLIPQIPAVYDEPFADSSQLPTMMISRVTRKDVKVVLTGDGGDEVFTGYTRYTALKKSDSRTFRPLVALAPALAKALRRLPPHRIEALLSPFTGSRDPSRILTRILELGQATDLGSNTSLYRSMVSHWHKPHELCGIKAEVVGDAWRLGTADAMTDAATLARVIDFYSYLPDDILVKVDRATMHVGLEARTPFLDRDVLEWSAQLPQRFSLRGNSGKWVLKELLSQYVPRHMFDRPKMGFGVPLAGWLRGPLREWASDLLAPPALAESGFFDTELIEQKWRAHLAGEDWAYPIWNILMFQAWLEFEKRG